MCPAAPPGLWLIDLAALENELWSLDEAAGILPSDERAWRTADGPWTRRARPLTRIVLRLLLRDVGATQATTAEISNEPGGRPFLVSGAATFSVSHSENLALVGIVPGADALGVDLQHVRKLRISQPRRQMLLAGGAALVSDTVTSPSSLFDHDDDAALVAAWTCLEAFAKARGGGIGCLLTELGITAAGARTLTADDVAARARALLAADAIAVERLSSSEGIGSHLPAAVAAPPARLRRPLCVVDLDARMLRRLAGQ